MAPTRVPSILFLPDIKDSETEDSIELMAPIPAKRGLSRCKTSTNTILKPTAMPVLIVLKPILYFLLIIIKIPLLYNNIINKYNKIFIPYLCNIKHC
jgi:hypothetical protein